MISTGLSGAKGECWRDITHLHMVVGEKSAQDLAWKSSEASTWRRIARTTDTGVDRCVAAPVGAKVPTGPLKEVF